VRDRGWVLLVCWVSETKGGEGKFEASLLEGKPVLQATVVLALKRSLRLTATPNY
jgi:hypothetical protein